MSGGFLYAYRTYTASVSGDVRQRVRCVECSLEYEYILRRRAYGEGHSAYFLANERASQLAEERARANLLRALDDEIDAVFCPACGIYQPDMVNLLKKQFGSKCDPNKWASMRTTISWPVAWQAVSAADTLEMYTRFCEMWPTHSDLAADRIWELKHPVIFKVRRVLAGTFWILWAVAILVFLILVLVSFLGVSFGRW